MKRFAPILVAALFAGAVVVAAPAVQRVIQYFNAGLVIGQTGIVIDHSGAATSSYAFGDVLANTCAETSAVTVTGATLGDICDMANPLATPAADAGVNYTMRCRVTATNTVKGKACAIGGNINLPDAGYKYRTFSQ